MGFFALLITHYLSSVFFLGADTEFAQAREFHLAVTLTMAAMTVGAVLANGVVRLRRGEISGFYREASAASPTRRDIRAVIGLGAVCLLVFGAFATGANSYPLRELLAGADTSQVNELRSMALGEESRPFWLLFGTFRVSVMPLLFICALLVWKHARGMVTRLALGCSMTVVLVYQSWTSAKTPVAMLAAFVAIALLIRRPERGNRSCGRTIVGLVLLGSIVVGYPFWIFSMKQFGQSNTAETVVVDGIVNRIARTPAELSYTQFEIFPEQLPYTEFRDISLLSRVLDREYVNLSRTTARLAHGTVSNAPPASPGNLYAQGGWWVLGIGSMLMGAVLHIVQVWAVRRLPASPLSIGLMVLLCWGAFRLSMTSFHSFLMTEAVVPFFAVAVMWMAYRGASRRRSHYPGSTDTLGLNATSVAREMPPELR